MEQKAKRGAWSSIKGFCITYVLPLVIVILVILTMFKLPVFDGIFNSLVRKSKKKQLDEKYRKTMIKIEDNDKQIESIQNKIAEEDKKVEKNNNKIEGLKEELAYFESEVENGKNDIATLDNLADDLL